MEMWDKATYRPCCPIFFGPTTIAAIDVVDVAILWYDRFSG
jgi:hypothetical protein